MKLTGLIMVKVNAKKRTYANFILMAIFLIIMNIVTRVTDDLSISLWIIIPLLIFFIIISSILMIPVKKELRKGGKAKAKTEVSLHLATTKILAILISTFGILFLIAGLILLAGFYLKSISTSEMPLFGGIALALLITGTMALFAGRGLSKRKKWGRNLATVVLSLFILLFLFVIIFGGMGGAIFGTILILAFLGIIYELQFKNQFLWID